jgi:glucose-6-phosphate isomerase
MTSDRPRFEQNLSYSYQGLLCPRGDEWSPRLELQTQHLLSPARLQALGPQLNQVRSQVAAQRSMAESAATLQPLDSGFIDLPDRLLSDHRARGKASDLGRIQTAGERLRELADRLVILGIGGSHMGARALFEALKSSYHNELPPESRMRAPRVYFEGNALDNDALADLLELLQVGCLNPDNRADRFATIVISKSGSTLETAAAFRVVRREAEELFRGEHDLLRQLMVPITGKRDSRLQAMFQAWGYRDDEIFDVPERVGGRFSVFSAVGMLPAAVLGLDVQALLMGAAQMTKRFLEEPFERNPVLQYAATGYLTAQELGKSTRVLAVWSKKLEALGLWYDQLLSESLGKQGRGPTPITAVEPRDLHSRGQQHQDGARDKLITNLIVTEPRSQPIAIGMADRNEDGLNELSRKKYPDLLRAAVSGTNQAYLDAARPTADLVLPSLTEYSLGQLMQMLMLATVVEGLLMGVNPYGQPGVEGYKRNMQAELRK